MTGKRTMNFGRFPSPCLWLLAVSIACVAGTRVAAAEAVRIRVAAPVAVAAEPADATPAAADGGVKPTSEGSARAPQIPVFHLRDSSMISGWPKLEALEVQTAFGNLVVPRDQISNVRFARRVDPELRTRIEGLVRNLGAEDFDAREAAMSELQAVGAPALELLREATKSSDDEVKSRAGSLVAEIEKKASGEQGGEEAPQGVRGSDDEVVTARMTIKGTVLQEEFLVETPFGQLRVGVADLAAIQFGSSRPTSGKAEVTAQHQPPGKWCDTKIDVEKGQALRISATGQITVRNYGIMAGPAGNTDWSGHATFENFPMLSLVGKVGKNGKPFLVGASYRGKAGNDGRLYLGIVAFSPNPMGSMGSYQAKIQTSSGR